MILGTLDDDPEADAEIADWCRIARVLHDLKRARIGHFGHVLENMLDMQTDPTALTAAFGCHTVETEPDDLLRQFRQVSDADAEAKKRQILEIFETPDPKSDPITRKLTSEDLDLAARVAVALERFVDENELDGLAYFYEAEPDSPMRRLVSNLIVGNSLLTAAGFPMCGESELKTCIAMLIEDRLGIGGSFAEFHPIDFRGGFVLVGHDGPRHLNLADGRPLLRSLFKYYCKPGRALQIRACRGPKPARSHSPHRQHQHARLLPARRAHLSEALGRRRPYPSFRHRHGKPSRRHPANRRDPRPRNGHCRKWRKERLSPKIRRAQPAVILSAAKNLALPRWILTPETSSLLPTSTGPFGRSRTSDGRSLRPPAN